MMTIINNSSTWPFSFPMITIRINLIAAVRLSAWVALLARQTTATSNHAAIPPAWISNYHGVRLIEDETVRTPSSRILRPTMQPNSCLSSSASKNSVEFESMFDEIEEVQGDVGMHENDEVSEFYRRDLGDDVNSPIADRPGLSKLLSQRFEMRKSSQYHKVKEIDVLLRRRHGVRAFDNPCVWTRSPKPPISYLRRRARRKAAEMVSRFGPTGHPYVQVGKGVDPVSCPLIMTEIHTFLSRRHQLQLQSRYEEADAMKFELMINGVFVNEVARQWRADGVHTFDKSSENKNNEPMVTRRYKEDEKSSNTVQDLDIKMVRRRIEQLLEKQSVAANREEIDLVDLLSYELYKTYGVGINEQSCTWSFGAKFKEKTNWKPPKLPDKISTLHKKNLFPPRLFEDDDAKYASPGYRQSKHSRNVPNDLIRLRIENLIQERIHLREEQKYIEADAIRKELWDTYYVGLNDRLRQWSVAGVLQEGDEANVRLQYVQTPDSLGLPIAKCEEVESLLRYLESTRHSDNESAADCIIQRLWDVYHVTVDEDRMEWSVQQRLGDPNQDNLVYRPRGFFQGIPLKQRNVIQSLVERRHKERKSGNQQIADTISEALWRKHQIEIDDEELTWQVR